MAVPRYNLQTLLQANLRILLLVTAVVLSIVFIGFIFFLRGKIIMEQQINLRLTSAASLAAQQFSAEDLDAIRGHLYVDTNKLFVVAKRLEQIKNTVPNVQHAYILRQGMESGTLEFVADAHIINPPKNWDRNRDGRVSKDEEPYFPGDMLDVRATDALRSGAFVRPTIGKSIHGQGDDGFISGYAPIRRRNGEVAAILGLDMHTGDYAVLTSSLVSPLILLLILLVAVFIGGYIGLFFWKRRVELLEKSDRESEAFLELMINQLATPLSVFRWWKRRARQTGLMEDHECNEFEDAIDQMDLVLRALHSAQSIEKGELQFEPRMGSLRGLIRRIVDEQRPRMMRNQQNADVVINDELTMPFDDKLTAAVLREIIDNAIDYSDDGTDITIRAYRMSSQVQVDIQDHGQGIAEEELSQIFDKFKRGSNAKFMQPVGKGLGLYIAKGIVEMMGGKLWLRSTKGEGTTVSFTLPLPA